MSTRPIRFVHRGAIVEVAGLPPTTSALTWLREHAGRTGTKEGCNEGDCGACTVLLGELDHRRRLRWRAVNACLMLLPMLDGRALRSVEDLRDDDPAACAMVEHHGSQCGFCTPGFVVSLAALRCSGPQRPSRQAIADALAGNLCRCTGYRPILDAGEAMYDTPARLHPDDAATEAALHTLDDDGPLDYRAPNPATAGVDRVQAPRTLDALADAAAAAPEATLLAGATDIGLWVNKQFRPLPHLISLHAVHALQRVDTIGEWLRIGAGATLEAAWAALAARHPELTELWKRFAGPPVRQAGTLGGNLANGSPIGDGAPVLMALDAELVLRHGSVERRLPLDGFYTGYMHNQRQAGELLLRIELPPAPPGLRLRAYKLSKRRDCDISALACGLALVLDADGRVAHTRLAFGGLAATVARARQAEAALLGQPWDEATLQAAQAALAQDFTPLTDLRGSAAYRQRSAQALLRRFWLETRAVNPLPAAALRVEEVQP